MPGDETLDHLFDYPDDNTLGDLDLSEFEQQLEDRHFQVMQLTADETAFLQFVQKLEQDIDAITDERLRSILRRMHDGYARSFG